MHCGEWVSATFKPGMDTINGGNETHKSCSEWPAAARYDPECGLIQRHVAGDAHLTSKTRSSERSTSFRKRVAITVS